MDLTDIIALAKQGYKPADIKELIELSKENDEEVSELENTTGDDGESDHTTQNENLEKEADESDSIDYKKLYEEEHAKLLNAQKNNVHKNIAESSKTDEDIVLDLFKNLK